MRKINIKETISAFVLILYFAELVFPFINTLYQRAFVCLACFILWVVLSFTSDLRFFLRGENLAILLTYLLLIIIPLFFGYSVISHRYANMGLVICGSIILRYYYSHDKMHVLRMVLIIAGILSLVTLFTTYTALLISPYISRSIKSSGEYSAELSRRGIGGYHFVYYVCLIGIEILYVAFRAKSKMKKWICYGLFIFCILFVIKSNYTTAFVVMIASSVVLVFSFLLMQRQNRFFFAIIAVSFVAIIIININTLVGIIAQFLPSRIASALFGYNGLSVVESLKYEFLDDRWPGMLLSIEAFFRHPILGLLGSTELDTTGTFLSGFGQHSFFLDTFALYGLIPGILNVYAVLRPFQSKHLPNESRAFRVSVMIATIILLLFNNATESIGLAFTIVYPFIDYYTEKNNIEKAVHQP